MSMTFLTCGLGPHPLGTFCLRQETCASLVSQQVEREDTFTLLPCPAKLGLEISLPDIQDLGT